MREGEEKKEERVKFVTYERKSYEVTSSGSFFRGKRILQMKISGIEEIDFIENVIVTNLIGVLEASMDTKFITLNLWICGP